MNKREAHKKQIKQHLLDYGHITPMIALNEYGCYRLGARIYDLRNEGMNIKTERGAGEMAMYINEDYLQK